MLVINHKPKHEIYFLKYKMYGLQGILCDSLYWYAETEEDTEGLKVSLLPVILCDSISYGKWSQAGGQQTLAILLPSSPATGVSKVYSDPVICVSVGVSELRSSHLGSEHSYPLSHHPVLCSSFHPFCSC